MVAINFKKQFVDKIYSGVKTQTCMEKKICKKGDRIKLWHKKQGQRMSFKIADAVCVDVFPIRIVNKNGYPLPMNMLQGCNNSFPSESKFSKDDGFDTIEDFKNWFVPNEGDIWSGYCIQWELAI